MNTIFKNKPLIQWLGLLGVISLLSYAAAVIFSPLAYPGYNWISQAVSDLTADTAPSRTLWNQLASLYGVCGVVSVTLVCIFIKGKLSKTIRLGVYLFAAMNWASSIGYAMFPLSDSGFNGAFQDIMHGFVVTPIVIILSISSLILFIIGGLRKKMYVSLGVCAAVCLGLMMFGAIGVATFPKELFGIPERFSVFAATIFNAILGVYLFLGFKQRAGIRSV